MADNGKSGGIGFCGLLTVLFIGLKLTGHIGWPWIWVVSPLWIPLALVVVLAVIAAILSAFISNK
jgi:hypothetical protein